MAHTPDPRANGPLQHTARAHENVQCGGVGPARGSAEVSWLPESECREKIDEILGRLGTAAEVEGRKNEPRDVEILLSLPGVGRIIAASLLAEASRPLRDKMYQALRTLSGVAPVTRRTGKGVWTIRMRRSCNQRLRNAVYHWAMIAAQCDPAWRERYAALRKRGCSHGRACRGVADSLLRVAVAMLKNRTLYDPARKRARAAA